MPRPNEHFVRSARPFLAGQRETYATVLLGILMQVYGAEVLNWDPLTIEAQVVDDFGVHMTSIVYDQLMSLVSVLNCDAVYRSVEVFDRTIDALCRCGSGDQDMPSPQQLAWAVFEITANDPDPYGLGSEVSPWGHDIALYTGVVLADAGMKRAPSTLEFATMPSWVPKDVSERPDDFTASFQSQQEQSAEIDRYVEGQFKQMVGHLREMGIEPARPVQAAAEDLPEADPLDALLPG